jgi:fructan beta-fructosidase
MEKQTTVFSEKYLLVPINPKAPWQTLTISAKNRQPYQLQVRLDASSPVWHMHIDVSAYIGIESEISPVFPLKAANRMEIPNLYAEPLRPQVHFSSRQGWLNDPNGLVKVGDTYHLFYQHNPADAVWQNMHWGHAVSADLLHWEEQDIALFPDEHGTMFSGSAIEDMDNVSGLGDGTAPPVLLFYTAAGSTPDRYTQCLAFSKDRGKTFQKYAKNPIIPNLAGNNRDPKVIWCEEINAFVMALYLDGGTRDFALFGSDNLLDWNQFQTITLPNDAECPDFYPLTDEEGNRRWILSGASDTYFVGQFANGLFVPEGNAKALSFGNNRAYASQTFSGIDNRRIRISWNRTDIPGTPFNCQMTFPVEMKLRRKEEGFVLTASPIAELQNLYTDGEPTAFHVTLRAFLHENAAIFVCGEKFALPFAGETELSMIIDKMGCEIYVNGGERFGAFGFVADYEKPLFAFENADVLKEEVHPLRSIWPI